MKATLWKVPIEAGKAVQLTEKYSARPVLSPDGKLIAFHHLDPQANPQWGLTVISSQGGFLKRFEVSPSGPRIVRWSPDGRALTYIDNRDGFSNIWIQPLAGGPPRKLTDFKGDQLFNFDWSRDGQLACSRGVVSSDVIMISSQ